MPYEIKILVSVKFDWSVATLIYESPVTVFVLQWQN